MLPRSFCELIPDDPELRTIYSRWYEERPGHRTCLFRLLQNGQLECQPCAERGYIACEEQLERLELRDKAEQKVRDGLVNQRSGLPPQQGLEVELPEGDAMRKAVVNEWDMAARNRLQRLLPAGVKLTGVCLQAHDVRLEFCLDAEEVCIEAIPR